MTHCQHRALQRLEHSSPCTCVSYLGAFAHASARSAQSLRCLRRPWVQTRWGRRDRMGRMPTVRQRRRPKGGGMTSLESLNSPADLGELHNTNGEELYN